MGVDLRLLPVDYLSDDGSWGHSHTTLELPRCRDLWDDIQESGAETPLGEAKIMSTVGGRIAEGPDAGELTYGLLRETAYGQPYTKIRAGQLAPLLAEHLPGHPVTAYIAASDPARWIILDWH